MRMAESDKDKSLSDEPAPRYRPLERFWPYADLPEEPTEEELLRLHPDLRAALFGPPEIPLSITLSLPAFAGPDYDTALAMAKASADYQESGQGAHFRHRARF